MLDKEESLYFDYRPYPFERPPELDGSGHRHDVAIVGAGPVGLAWRSDWPDKASGPWFWKPAIRKAAAAVRCIFRRSMEILHNLGVAEAFEQMALPWTSGKSYYRGEVIFELEMPTSDDERFFPMNNLQQNFIERLLLEKAAETGLVDVRWHNSVTRVVNEAGGTTLIVSTPEGRYDLHADWLIAADGARSIVRSELGLKLSGTSYSGAYLIADIQMQSNSPTERRAWFDPPTNRGSTILMHKQPKKHVARGLSAARRG